MNKHRLANYLQNIADGKSINWKAFIAQMEAMAMSEQRLAKILAWKKDKGNQYQVRILDELAFQQLRQDCQLPQLDNRVSASLSGNSHRRTVSGSLLTILGDGKNIPQCVVVDVTGNYQTELALHNHLLVVENLENYLALIENRDWLDLWLGEPWRGDILYAEGNAVSNQLHRSFFSRYQSIGCLLDIDLGGFEIFKNILALSQSGGADTRCYFSLSAYYQDKLQQYGRPLSHVQYKKLINRSYPTALQTAIETVLKAKKFAEQEILLWD